MHSGDNPSNHSAIFTRLQVDVEKIKSEKRVNWAKASDIAIENYKVRLSQKLNSLPQPERLNCQNLNCNHHSDSLEDYTMDILQAVEGTAKECLPSTGGARDYVKLTKPGWTEYVKPYCDESRFWHSVWLSSGSPTAGPLFEYMKSSKGQYKYAVRRLQRANDKIQNDKFVHSIIKGGANIFSEIKKYRGSSRQCSSRIDDEIGASNIAGHFARIYSSLYNQSEHGQQFEDICEQGNSLDQLARIDEDLVAKALKMMKKNKNYALFDFQSDCLTNGPPELVHHLTNLLKLYIIHGSVPHILLLCTLLPLVKDNLGDITSSDNYRAIASGSLKLLDIVILLLEGDTLGCDPMQFGFQAKSSTTMCTWAVNSVIDHFISNGRAVFGCAMDLSKAFDMVEWTELFTTLMERFSVNNGVSQGAVSSPLLFSVYINDLFKLLRDSGLGCYISNIFYACFGYADDLLLLSASRSGLQELVKICENFAVKKSLKFSTNVNPEKSKTKCIIFSKKHVDPNRVAPVLLNGDPLSWVPHVKHSGNTLQCDNFMN